MSMQRTGRRLEQSGARRMAGALGWVGLGLGVAGLLAPRRTARLIGVRGTRSAAAALRVVGLREVASGLGILTRPRPAGWLWGRVAGDVMDLALLVPALRSRRARPTRVALATVGVLGVTLLDLRCARQLARTTPRPRPAALRGTITINRPPEELYQRWRDFTNLPRFMRRLESVQGLGERRSHWRARGPAGAALEWDAEVVDDRPNELIAWRSLPGSQVDHAGVVRFERAPGGRGTQVTVELDYTPPGGMVGATLAKVLGSIPAREVQEDLRRFKQWMETGDIVLSEGVVRGVARPAVGDARRPARAVAVGGVR